LHDYKLYVGRNPCDDQLVACVGGSILFSSSFFVIYLIMEILRLMHPMVSIMYQIYLFFLGTGASIFFFRPLARQNIFHLLFFLWIPSSFIKPGLHFPPKNKKKSRGLIIGFVSRYHSSEWPFHHGSTRHDCYWSQIPTC